MFRFVSLFVAISCWSCPTNVVVVTADDPAAMKNGDHDDDLKPFVCYEGYVMDKFCIAQDGYKDDSTGTLKPLVHPGNHTAMCLLDAECYSSGYEILTDPTSTTENYTRAMALDKDGDMMMLNYGYRVGMGCTDCTGNVTQGIRATVIGVAGPDPHADHDHDHDDDHDDGSKEPAKLKETKVVLDSDIGCSTFDNAPTDDDKLICLEGYVSDVYCIELGEFLDTKGDPFTEAATHTIHCMVDVPICYESGFEVLSDPVTASNGDVTDDSNTNNKHARAVRMDAIGNALFIEYAKNIGKQGGSCKECRSTLESAPEMGLRATVIGYLEDGATAIGTGTTKEETDTPPTMHVLGIYDSSIGCDHFGHDHDDGDTDDSAATTTILATTMTIMAVSMMALA